MVVTEIMAIDTLLQHHTVAQDMLAVTQRISIIGAAIPT